MTLPVNRIGDLRQVVAFTRRTVTPDGMGNDLAAWAPIPGASAVYAKVAPLKGGEAVQAARVQATAIYVVTVRSDAISRTITPADRIAWNGLTFDITSILNLDERDRFLTITCVTGGADG